MKNQLAKTGLKNPQEVKFFINALAFVAVDNRKEAAYELFKGSNFQLEEGKGEAIRLSYNEEMTRHVQANNGLIPAAVELYDTIARGYAQAAIELAKDMPESLTREELLKRTESFGGLFRNVRVADDLAYNAVEIFDKAVGLIKDGKVVFDDMPELPVNKHAQKLLDNGYVPGRKPAEDFGIK